MAPDPDSHKAPPARSRSSHLQPQAAARWDPTIRDQLANLLDDAARRELTLLDTIGFLCEAESARKDDRRIQMVRELASAGTYVVANNGTTGWSSGPSPSAYGSMPRTR
jgi:hypothetical protein